MIRDLQAHGYNSEDMEFFMHKVLDYALKFAETAFKEVVDAECSTV
jgi:hypothetical protein